MADDVAEFLFAFAGAAETYPASIVVADMDVAGAPMIFVNRQVSVLLLLNLCGGGSVA